MVSRAMALVVVIVAALFGAPSSAATPSPTAVVIAYTYDGNHQAATTADTMSERGPPGCAYSNSANHAVGCWSHGASVGPDGRTTCVVTDYDHPHKQAQGARVPTTTAEAAGGGASSELACRSELSRVAAKTLAGSGPVPGVGGNRVDHRHAPSPRRHHRRPTGATSTAVIALQRLASFCRSVTAAANIRARTPTPRGRTR